MKRDPASLTSRTFDLLIVGGGIFGAGIARDAALRGLSVALVEKNDFASGTSSRSSKLIHGGFRYLEQMALGLVFESCRERRVLQHIAPTLVKPLPLLLPVYRGDPRSLLKLRLGMTLYDLLALYQNTAPHRLFGARQLRAQEPGLDGNGLAGGIRFFDCQEDDARFCLDNILHAAALGAACANYCEAEQFLQQSGRVRAAAAIDRLTGARFEIRAKVFVNAAGPWTPRVAALAKDRGPDSEKLALSPTKGVHILLPRLTRGHGIFFQARRDGRMMFILPWYDCTLVGTTDTDFTGNLDDIRAEPSDIEYLLAETNALLPEARIAGGDVIATTAGVRPLLRSDQTGPSQRSREHRIARTGENFFSVAGGKYTTYRAIAEQVVDRVFEAMGHAPPRCRTASTPIPIMRPPPTGQPLATSPEIFSSDIVHACENEMATSVSDVMLRRAGLALSRFGGAATAEKVAAIMAGVLGWTEIQKSNSLAAYSREGHGPPPGTK